MPRDPSSSSKKAFANGRSAAARLPSEAGIKAGDEITVTVLGPGKVLIETGEDLPDYSQVLPRRGKGKPSVTPALVARLMKDAGF